MTSVQVQFQSFLENSQEKTVINNGTAWKYFVIGSGPKSLVILTGGGSIAEAAFLYSNALSSEYNVIIPTIPAVYTMAECVEGISAILAQEGVSKSHFLGFSMGGMISQCFVRKYPTKVEKMVLFVSMLPSLSYAKKYTKYRVGISIVPESLFRWISKRSLAKQVRADKDKAAPEVIGFWLQFFAWEFDSKKINKQLLLATTDVLMDYFTNYQFSPNDLAQWEGKVLLIESDRDATVSKEERERFKNAYPMATVIAQKNSGHFGEGLLNPENVINEISLFLKD